MSRSIPVPKLEQPTRLDKFLVQELGSDWSRSAIQQAIKKGQVTVNGKKVPVHHFLKPGETIDLELGEHAPQPQPQPNSTVQYGLISETPDYLVIEKPAGLVVHPAPGIKESTLVDGLLAHYPELEKVGDDPLRPGIVHRLDREVSGLLLVARTPDSFEYFKRAFTGRRIHKTYLALVIGQVTQPSGTITFPLGRSKTKHGKIAARPEADDSTREAITHFEVIQRYQQVTLLKVTIETGRTHQIRAHLSALGYPVVGDRLYRPAKITFKATPKRIFLHAAELGFTDPTGVPQHFVSQLPVELAQFLATLK